MFFPLHQGMLWSKETPKFLCQMHSSKSDKIFLQLIPVHQRTSSVRTKFLHSHLLKCHMIMVDHQFKKKKSSGQQYTNNSTWYFLQHAVLTHFINMYFLTPDQPAWQGFPFLYHLKHLKGVELCYTLLLQLYIAFCLYSPKKEGYCITEQPTLTVIS